MIVIYVLLKEFASFCKGIIDIFLFMQGSIFIKEKEMACLISKKENDYTTSVDFWKALRFSIGVSGTISQPAETMVRPFVCWCIFFT
jgi:hypothetical protein